MSELQTLLKQAYEGREEAAQSFFESLLESSLVVPLKPVAAPPTELPTPGNKAAEQLQRFVTVSVEGRDTLPVFSEEGFLKQWAGEEVLYELRKFSALLRVLGPETWLHVDAGQEYGREISPWEIDLLKRGPEAIPAVIQEGDESEENQLEVDSKPEDLGEFKKRISIAAEAYNWISELKLLAIRDSEKSDWVPLVGLKVLDGESPEEKLKSQFKQEISDLIAEYRKPQPVIIEESDTTFSPHLSLVQQANPFYIRQLESSAELPDGVREVIKEPGENLSSVKSDSNPKGED